MYLSEREVKAIRARVRKHAEENANSTSGLLLDILSLTSSRRWSVVILQRGFSNARARMYRENLYEEQRQVIQCGALEEEVCSKLKKKSRQNRGFSCKERTRACVTRGRESLWRQF